MIEVLSVSSRGQIVIPQQIREHFGIKTGSKLILFQKEDGFFLKKEETVVKHFDETERKEDLGWMMLAEQSLKEIWDNPKDETVWKKYL